MNQDTRPPDGATNRSFIFYTSSLILALALAIVTLAVYLPVRECSFLRFDDADYVTDNGQVQSGLTWSGVKWAFTTGHASNWHPLTWVSHMLDVSLFGPGPAGPHLVNAGFHTANTVLLFLVLQLFTGARWRSALVAVVFALHPMHVESVAWVAERKDVLCAFFFLLTLQAYGSYASHRTSGHYAVCLLLFVLALLSKPMAVTLPFVLLLLDYWPLRRITHHASRITPWPLLREKLPFFLLAMGSCVATFVAQQRGGAVRSLSSFPVSERIGNALVAYVQYLGKLFWPVKLCIFYPHPGKWPLAEVLFAAVLIGGLSLAAIGLARRLPFVTTGWLWYLGTLVPVIGIVQVSNQSMADRYTYLPAIGVFIILAWGAGELASRWAGARIATSLAACLMVIACAVATRDQLQYWRNGETLFSHALAVTDRNFVAHNNLGNVLMDQGKVDEAMTHYQAALDIQPKYADALNNLGSALLEKGRVDEAVACYEKALALEPDYPLAHNNLGNALLRKGAIDDAMAEYKKTLALKPDYANTWNNLGAAWRQKGQLDEAIACFRKAVSLNPNHVKACNNLGDVFLQQGRPDEALKQFQRALELQSDLPETHHNLGVVLMQLGRADEATKHFEKVVELKAADAEARNNLGWCRLQSGHVDQAIAQFQKAVEIEPSFAAAQNNLGFALLQQGRARAAVTHLQTAAKLQPENTQTLSGLAWVLATCVDDSVRDGATSVELAERANRLAGGDNPLVLRALAAAYAEAGRFPEALTTVQRALQLTEAHSNPMLAGMLRKEMQFYQAGKPFRE